MHISGLKLQMCKVSSVLVHLLRKTDANETYGQREGQMDRHSDSYILLSVSRGINMDKLELFKWTAVCMTWFHGWCELLSVLCGPHSIYSVLCFHLSPWCLGCKQRHHCSMSVSPWRLHRIILENNSYVMAQSILAISIT